MLETMEDVTQEEVKSSNAVDIGTYDLESGHVPSTLWEPPHTPDIDPADYS